MLVSNLAFSANFARENNNHPVRNLEGTGYSEYLYPLIGTLALV